MTTRFAPSPTGWLHLGHAFAALFAQHAAGENGRFLLRIEDIDGTRARPEYETALFDDLEWLGLDWEKPVRRQSDHFDDYRAALTKLDAQELLYPCFCTRREIQDEIARAGDAPQGPDGPLYPGTCRHLDAAQRRARIEAGDAYALRLDVAKACAQLSAPLTFIEHSRGEITCLRAKTRLRAITSPSSSMMRCKASHSSRAVRICCPPRICIVFCSIYSAFPCRNGITTASSPMKPAKGSRNATTRVR
jgi:glutamyl/glutaminyl-tRNA synthetase